jgi:ribosome-associated translation inhibitor RaiA
MPNMATELLTPRTMLSDDTRRRIRRHLDGIERRLTKFHNHDLTLTVKERPTERRFTADALLALGVDGVELVGHTAAETPEAAARSAIEDIERQLERYVATLRGEASFGTPSRREPRDLRPGTQPADLDEDDYDAPAELAAP